ncbi:MAG: hypothetical protein IT343_16585 [Candidatus Melainabacteria bacterium]|jgi:Na+/glutamate symporter|nr:hypothetical protein [Candidatus Melainabacteria bacterium]
MDTLSFANFLPTILVIFVVAFTSGMVKQLVLNMFGVPNIANPSTQKLAGAALGSFVFTAMFAIGFALIGNPYTLTSFIFVWAIVGLLEYVLPTRR